MADTNMDNGATRRAGIQLKRLSLLTDVVYAIVLWRAFMLIPRPGVMETNWSSLRAYLTDEWVALALVLVAVIVTIIYWLQSNAIFGRLEKTDARHTTFAIFQLFFLMLFLYSMRLGIEVGGVPGTRFFESLTVALMGFASSFGFDYARKNRRLLHPDVTDTDAKTFATRIRAEPISAVITMPFAFVGPGAWELSWFVYPVVVALVKRRNRGEGAQR